MHKHTWHKRDVHQEDVGSESSTAQGMRSCLSWENTDERDGNIYLVLSVILILKASITSTTYAWIMASANCCVM